MFRAPELERGLWDSAASFKKLKALMQTPEAVEDSEQIPLLLCDNLQLFHSRVKSVSSASFSGLRFLTVIAQDETVISNSTLAYIYSGLSTDGRYYVSAHFSVFPPRSYDQEWTQCFNTLVSGGSASLAKGYPPYVKRAKEVLERLRPEDFVPDLRDLDTLIDSIAVQKW